MSEQATVERRVDLLWSDFSFNRTSERGLYWWRVPPREIGGLLLQPEWVEGLCLAGMGYGDAELWPLFSHWDGYQRTLPKGTQWAAVTVEDKERDERWPGLGLSPCPFCGSTPKLSWSQRSMQGGVYVGSRPYQANAFKLQCRCGMAGTRYWDSLSDLVESWNCRVVK